MFYYNGYPGRIVCFAKEKNGAEQPLNPRNDLYNHSPDGFNWGYAGSGPAQLALAILAHHFQHVDNNYILKLKKRCKQDGEKEPPALKSISWPDWFAIRLHNKFKFAFIANIPIDECFSITSEQISEFIEQISI